MNRRNQVLVFALLFSASFMAFGQSKGGSENQWGFLFDCKNLLALNGFEDGYQAGAGAKYWINSEFAARALARIKHNTPPDDDPVGLARTEIGLGLAGEWHPKQRAAASPYLGGLVGFQTLSVENATETLIDFYLGGLGGVEVKLLSSISCFAEYQLLASWDDTGFTLRLGTEGVDKSRALIGLIFYF